MGLGLRSLKLCVIDELRHRGQKTAELTSGRELIGAAFAARSISKYNSLFVQLNRIHSSK